MAERPSPARYCFGCGSENPHGLAMHFRLEGGRAAADFTPPEHLQGYPGFVHGGGVATMLDEAMGWAVYGQGIWAMTARLQMRFRDAISVGQPLSVTGWVTRDRGRFLELRAELRERSGKLLAEADGLFVRVTGRRAEEMRLTYEAALDGEAGRQTDTITSLNEGRP
jgi:acyl-coenzyme A thioesterase PaaI-like protein